ncbi:MAG TPA: pitrilysin family protein [Bacteroidales bacterium]|nr:pitrilysin family protein [Bacteroidales bacterium]HOM40796.1 pitrilysin family protein [Bacteroidales bacterium]HPP92447.1 pitrilysin family protein [Bacteroidales bacterium]
MKTQKSDRPPVNPINIEFISQPEKIILSNKVPVYFIKGGNEEITKIDFVFRAGFTAEEIPLQSSTTARMLTEGSEHMTASEINHELDYYGITFNAASDRDSTIISAIFLNRHFTKALELLKEIIFSPRFPEDEFKTLMNRRLQWFLINREKVSTIATEYFFESVFGKSHPYGLRLNAEDFSRIKPAHLRNFHSRYYIPQEMTLFVSGKTPTGVIEHLENYVGSIVHYPADRKKSPPLPYGEKKRNLFIPKEGAVQSAIRIGSQTIKRSNPDFSSLLIVNTLLGGYFGSRLMKNLREEKGYTYGISSYLVSLDLAGYLLIATEVGKKYTQKAVKEIFKEIKILQKEPVKDKELEMVKNYMLSDLVRMFDGPFATAESFRLVWESGMDMSYFQTLAQKIKSITPDEIIHIARSYYDTGELYTVIAGPEK